MPLAEGTQKTELDLGKLWNIFDILPFGAIALEWNTTRPGEPPEPCYRFGLQTGAIAMAVTGVGLHLFKVSPMAWKNKFGLKGKDKDRNSSLGVAFWHNLGLPDQVTNLIYGPRGGLLDGRLDACLMAWYIRSCSPTYRG
jgi:hypothetical protein